MNALERLLEDVRVAVFEAHCKEDVAEGCIGVVAAFCADLEAVEVRRFKGRPGEGCSSEDWLAMPGSDQAAEGFDADSRSYEIECLTIYVPRKQQTLAEVAERTLGYLRTFVPAFDKDNHERIQGALAAALKREADNAKG